MLRFLKKMFRGKPPLKVSARDLPAWFSHKVERSSQGFDGSIQIFYQNVKNSANNLRSLSIDLRSAQLNEPESVEPRVRNVVLGHRDNYCRELGLLVNSIEVPEETTFLGARSFSQKLRENLDTFASSTAKSYSATSHLFHEYTDKIAVELSSISDTLQKFHDGMAKRGLSGIDEVRALVNELSAEKKRRQRLVEELALKESRLSQSRAQYKKKLAEIEAYHHNSEYKEYLRLKEESLKLKSSLQELKNSITSLFLQVDRALKKYEYVALGSEQKLVSQYLNDPVSALVQDNDLLILNSLSKLRQDVKDEKLLEKLKAFTAQSLNSLKTEYAGISSRLDQIASQLKLSNAARKLKELEYKREHYENQVKRFEKSLSDIQKKLTVDNEPQIKQKIEQKVKDFFGTNLVIT